MHQAFLQQPVVLEHSALGDIGRQQGHPLERVGGWQPYAAAGMHQSSAWRPCHLYTGRRVYSFTSAHSLLYAAAYLSNLLHTRRAPHTGIYRLWQTKQLHALCSLPPQPCKSSKGWQPRASQPPVGTPAQTGPTPCLTTRPDGAASRQHACRQEVRDLGAPALVDPAIRQPHLVQLVQLGLHEVVVACLPRVLIPAPGTRTRSPLGTPMERFHTCKRCQRVAHR